MRNLGIVNLGNYGIVPFSNVFFLTYAPILFKATCVMMR